MSKVFALLLLASGGVGLFFSMREVIWEARLVRDFVPVPARVISADTPGLAAGKSQQAFFPTIHYGYGYDGKPYDSCRIWPYVGTVYKPEAQRLMGSFPTGATVTAYVNPRNPADAVLLREYSTYPYWPAAASLVATALGVGGSLRFLRPERKRMQTTIANDFGWRQLAPAKRFTERLYESIFLFVAVGFTMMALAGHLAAHSPIGSPFTAVFVAMAVLIFFWLGYRVVHASRIPHRMSDLRLIVNSAPMRLDQPFIFRVEATVRSRMQFTEMRARMVCIKRNLLHHGRRTHLQNIVLGERVLKLVGKSAIPAGELLKGTGETIFKSDDWPPSGKDGMTQYPYNVWEIRIEMIGPTSFAATFPLEVIGHKSMRMGRVSAIG